MAIEGAPLDLDETRSSMEDPAVHWTPHAVVSGGYQDDDYAAKAYSEPAHDAGLYSESSSLHDNGEDLSGLQKVDSQSEAGGPVATSTRRMHVLKEELERAEGELHEAAALRAEAEGLDDPAFAADAAAMELRLQDTVQALHAELARIAAERARNTRALRERLLKLQFSERHARTVLIGGGTTPPASRAATPVPGAGRTACLSSSALPALARGSGGSDGPVARGEDGPGRTPSPRSEPGPPRHEACSSWGSSDHGSPSAAGQWVPMPLPTRPHPGGIANGGPPAPAWRASLTAAPTPARPLRGAAPPGLDDPTNALPDVIRQASPSPVDCLAADPSRASSLSTLPLFGGASANVPQVPATLPHPLAPVPASRSHDSLFSLASSSSVPPFAVTRPPNAAATTACSTAAGRLDAGQEGFVPDYRKPVLTGREHSGNPFAAPGAPLSAAPDSAGEGLAVPDARPSPGPEPGLPPPPPSPWASAAVQAGGAALAAEPPGWAPPRRAPPLPPASQTPAHLPASQSSPSLRGLHHPPGPLSNGAPAAAGSLSSSLGSFGSLGPGNLALAGWTPMGAEDRAKCAAAYDAQGGDSSGGMSRAAAGGVCSAAGLAAPFAAAWALADRGGRGRLGLPEFCLLMHLVLGARRGLSLPASLTPDQVSELLGERPASQGQLAAGLRSHRQSINGSVAGTYSVASEADSSAWAAADHEAMKGYPEGLGGNRAPTRFSDDPSAQAAAEELRDAVANGCDPAHLQQALDACDNDVVAAAAWLRLRTPPLGHLPLPDGPAHTPSLPASPGHPSPVPGFHSEASPTSSVPASSVPDAEPAPAPMPSPEAPLQPGVPATGGVRLLVVLEKCCVAYRKVLDRPFFTLTLRTASGQPLELTHNTPPGYFDARAAAITSTHAVRLRTPVAHIPPGSHLLIEVRHWKSTEKKMSVLAWSFLEIDRVVEGAGGPDPLVRSGAMFLHLYRKPVEMQVRPGKHRTMSTTHDLFISVSPS